MAYTYEASYHHSPHRMKCETLGEAIQFAATDLEMGNAWPAKILAPDGALIWEEGGPFTTAGTLKTLAEATNVEWPDV